MFLQERSLKKEESFSASVILVLFWFTTYSETFCKFTVTNMSISDSTDSGGEMSCDKVVTNVFWHQWADVMFCYPVGKLLFQYHSLMKTNCLLKLIYSQVWVPQNDFAPLIWWQSRVPSFQIIFFFLKWIFDWFESWLVPVVPLSWSPKSELTQH